MKSLITAIGFLLLAGVGSAFAACGDGSSACFWIGGGANANWNTVGNWSNTSGGASSGTTPATGDSACFDSAGNSNSSLNGSYSLISIDFTGACTGGSGSPYTATLTHSNGATLTLTGNDSTANGGVTFRFSSGMTYTKTNAQGALTSFTSTSGTSSITLASTNHILGTTTFNGVGGTFQLNDSFRTAGGFNVSGGTVNANNQNVTANNFNANLTTNTRGVIMGSGTWTITSTGPEISWDTNTATGLTVTANTSTIIFNSTVVGVRSMYPGVQTYNNIEVTANAVTSQRFDFIGAAAGKFTANNITIGPNIQNVSFARQAVGATITGNLTFNATQANPGSFMPHASTNSATNITPITLAGTGTMSWVYIANINEDGAGTLTCTNCWDGGGNTLTIIPPPTGGGIRPGIQ